MVAGKLPERLPAGWTEQVKVTNGRKVKYYYKKETGQKFYSKKDVIRYVEMGNPCRGTPQQKSKHNKTSLENKPMPPAVETYETPEWLPHGWITEVKTCSKGSRMGRQYKCYIDQLTGRKFYSKPQVSEYLKTIKPDSFASHQKKTGIGPVCNPNHGELTRGKTSPKLEGSQNGEALEGTSGASKQMPIGVGEQSVKEVMLNRVTLDASQNQETMEVTSCASKQKQISFSKHSAKKVVIERDTPDGLPLGWIKETKIEKKANGTRRDPYYTDPVSGYVFRSQKDALRYLETGDFSKCALKPKKRGELRFLSEDISVSLPSAANQQLGHHTTTRQPSEGLESHVAGSLETTDAEGVQKRQCKSVSSTPNGKHTLENGLKDCAEMKESNDLSSSQLPRTEGSKRKLVWVCAENGTSSSPSSPLTGLVQGEKVEDKVVRNSNNRNVQIGSSKSKGKAECRFPSRSSKRLAGIEPGMEVNLMLGKRVLRDAARRSGKNEAKPSLSLDDVVLPPPQPFESVSVTDREVPSKVEQSNRSQKPLENQGAADEKSVKQETEKKCEDMGSPILCPFGDSLSDPSLEFAFKIPTGKMPLEEDNLPIQGTGNSVSSHLETKDAEGLTKRQCTSVSADATITSTPTLKIQEGEYSLHAVIKECAEGSDRKTGERVCAENGISTPSTEMVQEENENGTGKCRSRMMQVDSNKPKKEKAVNLPRRSSKRLVGLKPEMEVNLALSEQVLRAAARKTAETEAKHNVAHAAHQPFETVSVTDIANHAFSGTEAPTNVERSKKPLEEQPVRQETEKKDEENLESPLVYPFDDSWSDPCLEFAFKTLTGAIPIEDNLAIQGYFQHQVDTSTPHMDGCLSLPECGFPNFFQSEISSDFDATGKLLSEPHLPGSPALPSCSGNTQPPPPSVEGNEEHQTKANT